MVLKCLSFYSRSHTGTLLFQRLSIPARTQWLAELPFRRNLKKNKAVNRWAGLAKMPFTVPKLSACETNRWQGFGGPSNLDRSQPPVGENSQALLAGHIIWSPSLEEGSHSRAAVSFILDSDSKKWISRSSFQDQPDECPHCPDGKLSLLTPWSPNSDTERTTKTAPSLDWENRE